MKTCTGCSRSLPLDQYYVVHRHGVREVCARCKQCVASYLKARRANPDVRTREQQAYRKKVDAGWRGTEYAKRTKAQRSAAYEAVARWRKANPQWKTVDNMRRRLTRSQAFAEAWPLIVRRYGGHCLCCTAPAFSDHVVPLKPKCDSALNQLTNLQPLCRKCNTSKGQIAGDTDHRPDKGAWIVELVRLNPTLLIDHGQKRGIHAARVHLPLALPK